jgi:O-antigen ligase
MSGLVLALALAVMPTAVAMQSRAATPILVAASLLALWAERARLVALARQGGAALAPFGVLAAWAVASALWSVAPSVSLDGALRFASLVAIGAVAVAAAGSLDAAGRRRAAGGLVLGTAVAAAVLIVEALTNGWLSNAVRLFPALVRTVDNVKPGASVLVVLLPPAVAAAFARRGTGAAVALASAGAIGVMAVPSEAARLALVAGAAAAAVAALAPRFVRRVGPLLLALAVLAGPSLLQTTGEAAARAGMLPPSALHRVAIWDFVSGRAAERPLAGWGFEASRVLPGSQDRVPAATLDRLAPRGPTRDVLDGLPDHALQRLPLHPHNGGLQIRLELGIVGLLLAAIAAWWTGRGIARAPEGIALVAGYGAAAAGVTVGMIAFGVWQAWWIAALLLAAAAWWVIARAEGHR